MSNLFDYLAWRGDLSFGNAPLCPVDALIFSILAYINLSPAVPGDFRAEPVRLADAAERYFEINKKSENEESRHDKFLRALASSQRFSQLRLIGCQRETNREDGIQFGAISVLLPAGGLFLSFEGTDSTLVGWKEDFRMSYECPVPAQLRAVEYFTAATEAFPLRKLYLGGHSKGGNLAMYAAVFAENAYRDRIKTVYNNDGPGFCDSTVSSAEYLGMRSRIKTFMPQSSVVAVLLEHDSNYKIVKSENHGIAQHDAYSWQILGNDFEYAAERTAFGKKTEAIFDHFISNISQERKKQFCLALFDILEASKQETVAGIAGNKRQSLKNIVKAYSGLTPELRALLSDTVKELKRADKEVKKELPEAK